MDRFYPGPEWSGNQEVSQPIQNTSAHTPPEKKTSDNLSVKSKLRKLAEFRSRNKEFGSNDSLHLNPLNRSFSDPWLLKGDQREMNNELDLSKSVSASNSNLTKEKVPKWALNQILTRIKHCKCRKKVPKWALNQILTRIKHCKCRKKVPKWALNQILTRIKHCKCRKKVPKWALNQILTRIKHCKCRKKVPKWALNQILTRIKHCKCRKKNECRKLPMMSNGLTSAGSESYVNRLASAGSESYVNTLWQQQLELMQKSVNAYQKMSNLDMSNGMIQNPYLSYPGYNYADISPKNVVEGKTPSNKSSVKEEILGKPQFPIGSTLQNHHSEQSSEIHYAQHPLTKLPPIHSLQHTHETTVHWKPTNENVTKTPNYHYQPTFDLSLEKQNLQFDQNNQDLSDIKHINSYHAHRPLDFKTDDKDVVGFSKGQQKDICHQHPVDFSTSQQKELPSNFPMDFTKRQHELPSQYPIDFVKGQQNKLPTHFPMDFDKGQQNELHSQFQMELVKYPTDFSKGQQNKLPSPYPNDLSKGQQNKFPSQYPNDLSKGQQNKLPSQYPMDFSKGQQNTLPSQYPNDLSKGQQNTLPHPYPNDLSKGQQNKLPSPYPNDLSKGQQNKLPSQYPMDFSKGQQNTLPSQYPMDFSKGQQNTLPSQYPNDLSKGQQNKLPYQYPMDFSKGQQNTLPSQYPNDFSKGHQNEIEIQSMMEFSKRQHNDLDSQLPVQFNKGQHNYQLASSTSVDFRNTVHPMSTKGNNSQPYATDLSSQALTDYKDKQNAFFGRSFSHERKKTEGEMFKQKQEATSKEKQEKPFYPADNYLNGAFYNLPPPNKEVKKKKKIHSEQATSTQEKITPNVKGDNTNGQYPYMQYPYLPNYYSDPHMMKALIAHQKMYMDNAMEQHNQLKRKNPVLEEMDKQKIKKAKKSGNKMKKQGDTDKTVVHTQQDQFKNKYLSTDIKKSLKANSEALSLIKNRVQEILNTAASEIHANSHTEEKSQKSDIPSTASEIEMDVDFLDAHESLLTSDTITDPCCGNCEKLGMRYSPLCEEKLKRSSACDIPNLFCDNKDISFKPSANTSTIDFEKSTCISHKKLEKCDTDEVRGNITSDVYSFSDEYSDMNTSRLSLPLLSNTKSNGISTSSVTSEQQNLNHNSSNINSVSKNTDSVSSEHWQEKIAFMPQTFLNQNNLLLVSENSTTQAYLNQTNLLSKISNSITQVSSSVQPTSASQASSSQFNPFINGLRKDLFSVTHSRSECNTSNIPVAVVNTHSVETTSISTTLAKTLASSDGTCVTSVSSAASSNNSVFQSMAVSSSIPACNVSEKLDDVNFKVPESAKYLPPISAISRLENNLSNEYFDRSFENEELNEKLDDLSGLLDTTENSDDEKENLFQNVASKSFEEVDNILHNIKPNECLPESGLDQLAWVADHIQKIKEKVTGEDDDITTRLKNNEKLEIPQCTCRGPGYIPSEDIESPYYTHLGAARSIQGIRDLMEERTGVTGKALRIEKIRYTSKEGKSSQGCPIAKWIIRRSSLEEKYLVVVKQRPGHFCETAVLMVVAVAWEGIEQNMAADMYDYLRRTLTANGFETERRCGTNERKTCACQGINLSKRGASFSFGCSWSMYFNGCKFARSQSARKFKLKDTSKEEELEHRFQKLATDIAPLYQKVAPDAYSNQIAFEDKALDCRLGLKEGRPFTGVTSCIDFCAHAHKDLHNMNNGSTVVVTLTKHRGLDKPDDEQLHVLPLYVMDMSDEHGSTDAQYEKIKSGALEVLNHYQMEARIRATPLTPSRRKKKGDKKGSPGRKKGSVNANKTSSPITPKNNVTNSQDLNSSSDLYFRSESDKSNSGTPQKPSKTSTGLSSQTYEELMNMASQPELNDLYDSFWNYFYSFGSFPPADFMASMNMKAKDIVKKSKTLNQNSNSRQQSLDMNPSVQNQTNSQILSGEITPSEKMCNNFSGIVKDIQNMSPTFKNGALEHNTSDIERQPNTLPIDLSHKQESFVNPLSNSSNSFHSSDPNRSNGESKPNAAFDSPLHLLSEAVSMRTKEYGSNYPSQDLPQNTQPYHHVGKSSLNTAVHHDQRWGQYNYAKAKNGVSEQCKNSLNPVQQNVVNNTEEIDQNILKCEMEYNENAFADSEVGGVAIALCHGSVLFEVAKRELHATTGLKNPNRCSPTRISLVFYQHKNLNNEHHGMYVYAKKCERVRQKRLQDVMNGTSDKPTGSPVEKIKGSMKKKKSKKEEKFDIMKTSAAQYKYMWDTTTVRADAMTTDSVVTRWIDPQPMITGPYQRWI